MRACHLQLHSTAICWDQVWAPYFRLLCSRGTNVTVRGRAELAAGLVRACGPHLHRDMRRSLVNRLLLHAHSTAPLLCAPQTLTAPLLRTPLTADCAQHRTQVKSRALRIWARLCCTMSRRESTAAATQPVVALLRAAAALLRRFSNPRPHSAVLAVCITSWSDERGVKWSGTLSSFALVPPHVPADAHCCLTVVHHNLVQRSTMRFVHPWRSMVDYSTQVCLRRLVQAGNCGHEAATAADVARGGAGRSQRRDGGCDTSGH